MIFARRHTDEFKGTRSGFETALDYLDQAANLNPDEIESELIQKKKTSIRELMDTLKETTQ